MGGLSEKHFLQVFDEGTDMKQHRYRITVEHLADEKGVPVTEPHTLQFEVGNHDEILSVVERLRGRSDLPPELVPAFGVGLKLFGEVLLEHREHPLFSELYSHFGDFMRKLKGKSGGGRQP